LKSLSHDDDDKNTTYHLLFECFFSYLFTMSSSLFLCSVEMIFAYIFVTIPMAV